MGFSGAFVRPFRPAFDAGAAAEIPWYLSGGINASNCIAAYLFKGAASYAASRINLVTGIDDLTTTSAPSWGASTGLTFTIDQWLLSSITWATTYSAIVLVNNVSATINDANAISGGAVGGYSWHIMPSSADFRIYANGVASLSKAGRQTGKAVMAIAANKAYLNGSDDGNITVVAFSGGTVYLGNSGLKNRGLRGDLLAVAIYNTGLTATQIGLGYPTWAAL